MKIKVPRSMQFLFRPKQFKIAFGGRVGAKTFNFSRAAVYKGAERPLRILCAREFMNSIEESVHSSLSREIAELGMGHLYNVGAKKIDGHNGTAVRYIGLARNLPSVKSYDNFDIVWVEEAEYITQKSLDVLIPTMRKKGAELWFSFNPESEFSAIWTMIKPYLDEVRARGFYEDDLFFIRRTNIEDNPFAPQDKVDEAARMKIADYKKWLWIYGGEPFSDYSESIIQPEWFEAAINSHERLGFKPAGVRSLGFDLADTGDSKALIASHGPAVINGMQWGHGELPDAIDLAFEKARDWGAEDLVYDDDGLGRSMKVYLAKTVRPAWLRVTPYNGGAGVEDPDEIYNIDDPPEYQKKNRDTFKNRRAQKSWALKDRFESTYNAVEKGVYTDPDRLISLPPDLPDLDVLKAETISIRRVRGNNNTIQIESKKDMLKRGVKSPNYWDALTMCFANPAPEPAPLNLIFESEF